MRRAFRGWATYRTRPRDCFDTDRALEKTNRSWVLTSPTEVSRRATSLIILPFAPSYYPMEICACEPTISRREKIATGPVIRRSGRRLLLKRNGRARHIASERWKPPPDVHTMYVPARNYADRRPSDHTLWTTDDEAERYPISGLLVRPAAAQVSVPSLAKSCMCRNRCYGIWPRCYEIHTAIERSGDRPRNSRRGPPFMRHRHGFQSPTVLLV